MDDSEQIDTLLQSAFFYLLISSYLFLSIGLAFPMYLLC